MPATCAYSLWQILAPSLCLCEAAALPPELAAPRQIIRSAGRRLPRPRWQSGHYFLRSGSDAHLCLRATDLILAPPARLLPPGLQANSQGAFGGGVDDACRGASQGVLGMSARMRMWVHARRGPRGVHPHALLSTQPRYTYMPQLLLHTHTREGVLLKCSVIAQAITVYWSDRVRGCDTCTLHALCLFTPRNQLADLRDLSLSLLAAPCGHATRACCVTAESG